MKKILHLATHLNPGGITMYILRLAGPLATRKFDMHVASSGGEYHDLFDSEGVTLHNLDIRTKSILNPKVFTAIGSLVRLIRKEGIDLIHAHTRVTQVPAVVAGRKTGVPVVTTCHGFYQRRLGRRLFPAWGDRVVAISEAVAEHLHTDFKVPDARITVIPNGVEIPEDSRKALAETARHTRETLGVAPEAPLIGCVARLVKEKGQHTLLRAFAQIAQQAPEARLVIVGEGRERESLETLTGELGQEDRVIFTGNVVDTSGILPALDIFALPAVWKEAFGLTLVEAAAYGKPLVVTGQSALAPYIRQYGAGLLVEKENVEELREALLRLLHNPGERQEMGRSARRMAGTEFRIERMAEGMARLYNELLTAH